MMSKLSEVSPEFLHKDRENLSARISGLYRIIPDYNRLLVLFLLLFSIANCFAQDRVGASVSRAHSPSGAA